MVIPLDFFLLLTCSSWLMIANCAVLKINAREWCMLSGALWHLHPTCCRMYQKKSQCGQIRSGQLKTEIRWRCVLRHTLWSHLLGCRPSCSHYKGKYIAQNASLSWDPSAGLWVICCPCGWQILRKVMCFGMWSCVTGQVRPDILKALCFLKLLGAAYLVTVTHSGRLVSLETPLLDPRILRHEYTVYATECNVVMILELGKIKFSHWAARSSDVASFKKILFVAEKDIINFLQVILRLFWNSCVGYLNVLLLKKMTFKFSYRRGGVEAEAWNFACIFRIILYCAVPNIIKIGPQDRHIPPCI